MSEQTHSALEHFPITFFTTVMGMSGLTLALHAGGRALGLTDVTSSVALAATVVWFMVAGVVGGAAALANPPKEMLQAAALPVVNQIVMQSGLSATCSSVVITGESSKGLYDAIATLSDGSTLKIQIQLKGQQILVNVPPQ